MKLEQVCQALGAYFEQHPVFKVLMPLGTPIMLACVILQEVGLFVNLGSVVETIAYLGFFLGLLLVLAACNFKMSAAGMGIFALGYLFSVLRSLIQYHSIYYSGIIYLLLFGFLAYQSYRKSLLINK